MAGVVAGIVVDVVGDMAGVSHREHGSLGCSVLQHCRATLWRESMTVILEKVKSHIEYTKYYYLTLFLYHLTYMDWSIEAPSFLPCSQHSS